MSTNRRWQQELQRFICAYVLAGLSLAGARQTSAAETMTGTSTSGPTLFNVDFMQSSNSEKSTQKALSVGWIRNPFNFHHNYPWEKENQYSYSIDADVFSGKNVERSFDGARVFAAFWQKINNAVFFQLGLGLHYLRAIDTTPVVGGQIGFKPNEHWRLQGRVSDDFAYPVGFQPGATRGSLRRTVYEFTANYQPVETIKIPLKLKQAQFSDTNRISNVNCAVLTAFLRSEHQIWIGGKYDYEGSKISSYTTDLGYFSAVKWIKWSFELESYFKLSKNFSSTASVSVGKVSQTSNPSSTDSSADVSLVYGSVTSHQFALGYYYRKYFRDLTAFNESKTTVGWNSRF